MEDIIQLLPDNIANQIAAGEVIQRPASAVKELLENAVDAGADEIRLIVDDAGKALVQVIDNGKGMSCSDARMAFERHATSKIQHIDDLFRIKTMGFRGEALASIAAVAQVELKTRRRDDDAGIYIEIENSMVKLQEPAGTPAGSNIAMKNLFFNVPARRNFLKSNAAELRHIVDEFIRVAMAFPGIFFSFSSNGQQVFHLEKGTLKHRIVQILGNNYNAKLVSVQEETDYLNISGFVGKPDIAKKTRGDQYFFVNNRFIKSAYLNHAVMSAFAEMIPRDSYPMYALFIDLDPAQLDINVHPTKQEIKFEDEKIVYAFVQSAVKHALAQFSITPTLDFELDLSIERLNSVSQPQTENQRTNAASAALFDTFTQKNQAHFLNHKSELQHWKKFYEPAATLPEKKEFIPALTHPAPQILHTDYQGEQVPVQLHGCYVLLQNTSGFLLIHQQNAHDRILYDRFVKALEGKPMAIQQSLFPAVVDLAASDAVLLTELLDDLKLLGYQLDPFGANSFIVHGTPADCIQGNEATIIENMLEQYKHFSADIRYSRREKLLRSLAAQQSVKAGTSLSLPEMQTLVTDLFACSVANSTAGGKPTYLTFKKEELNKMFGR